MSSSLTISKVRPNHTPGGPEVSIDFLKNTVGVGSLPFTTALASEARFAKTPASLDTQARIIMDIT